MNHPHTPNHEHAPNLSEANALTQFLESRISRRTAGKLLAVPALSSAIGTLGTGVQPAQAAGRPISRGDFVALISHHFDWVHSSEYIDPYRLPQPTFRDVHVGSTPNAKEIETALEEHVISNAEPRFLPRQAITREEAAAMIARAFHLSAEVRDALAPFRDARLIDPALRPQVNAVVAGGYLAGTSADRFSPRQHLTETEARALLDAVTSTLVSPPQVMCKPGTTAPRRYVAISTPTEGATIRYTYTFDGSEPADPGAGSPTFDLRQNGVLQFVNPLDSTTDSRFYRLKAVASKDGMITSAVREFSWTIVRPKYGDWRSTVVHEATASSPKIWKINNPAEYYQANVYYIEGSRRGLVFDAGEYGHDKSNLKDYIDTLASKPYDLLLGHNHPDHAEQVSNFTASGITAYMSAIERASLAASSRADFQAAAKAATVLEDGAEIDLGNVQLTVFQAPGHTHGLVTALINQTGWVYASDHFGCNRPYTADTTQYNLIKADRFLSLQHQLLQAYRDASDDGEIHEVTNAHQDFPVGMACVENFVECFQQLIDEGPAVTEPSIRGGISGNPTGPVRNSRMSKVGDMWRDKNWMAIGNSLGSGWDKPIDYLSAPTTAYPSGVAIDYNADGGHLKYSILSNVVVTGGALVGVDFYWAAPANGVANKLSNRFDPWTYEYAITVPSGRTSVTLAPRAMSNRVASLTVDGRAIGQGEAVAVPFAEGRRVVVEVVSPDRSSTSRYVFTLRRA